MKRLKDPHRQSASSQLHSGYVAASLTPSRVGSPSNQGAYM